MIVSICIITYNHERFIDQAISGVMMQKTNFDFEVIVSNDCSSDATGSKVKNFIKDHPNGHKIKYYEHPNNIGMLRNFTFALGECAGKYIALCEGDDYWADPLKLQKQVDFLENNMDFVIAYHDAKVLNSDGKTIKQSKLGESWKINYSAEELKKAPFILTLTVCFRNLIKEFPKEFYKVLNADSFLYSLLGQYGKGKYMGEILPACYRAHGGGVWSSRSAIEKRKSSIATYRSLRDYYTRVGDIITADYFRNKVRDLFVEIVDKTPFLPHFRAMSDLFYKEGGAKSWIWFMIYILNHRLSIPVNRIKRRLGESVEP